MASNATELLEALCDAIELWLHEEPEMRASSRFQELLDIVRQARRVFGVDLTSQLRLGW